MLLQRHFKLKGKYRLIQLVGLEEKRNLQKKIALMLMVRF